MYLEDPEQLLAVHKGLQELEREAMLLDRNAVLRLVAYARGLRQAAEAALRARYQNGTADGAAMSRFASAVDDITDDVIGVGADR